MYLPAFSKDAFKTLITRYHPDNAETGDRAKYEEVLAWREAWESPTKVGDFTGFMLKHAHMTRRYKVTMFKNKAVENKVLVKGMNDKGIRDTDLDLVGDMYLKLSNHPTVNRHMDYLWNSLRAMTKNDGGILHKYFHTLDKVGQFTFNIDGRRTNLNYYTYYAARSFTIDELKSIMGTVDTVHIVWMFNRILEGMIEMYEYGYSMNAAMPQHFAFIPQNHGIYFLGSSFASLTAKNIIYPKGYLNRDLKGKDRVIYDVMMAGRALSEICSDVEFKRFLDNCNDMPEQILSEWTKFWGDRMERAWHVFEVPA